MKSCRLVCVLLAVIAVDVVVARAQVAGGAGRDCAVCHLGWMSDFDRREAAPLIAPPIGLGAADEVVCLGCHDGSVGDDRRTVWFEHGHKTGVVPPQEMAVPESLPLEDGRIACRTCHSAHAGRGPETLATAVFVRTPPGFDGLCVACHAGYEAGAGSGSHPMGELPWPVPPELERTARHGRGEGHDMTCETCHVAHGSSEDHLLVMSAKNSRFCLACHEKLDPTTWSPANRSQHHPIAMADDPAGPVSPVKRGDPEAKAPNCLDCHQMHRSPSKANLLARSPERGELCAQCHADQQSVVDSKHNLSVSSPAAQNALGLTAEQSGMCGACHGIHGLARTPVEAPGDASGSCTTCHRNADCASPVDMGSNSHPYRLSAGAVPETNRLELFSDPAADESRILDCRSCHEPHSTAHDRFLRSPPDTICLQCHGDHLSSLKGAHDMVSHHPDVKNAKDRNAADTGRCGFCHAVHHAAGPILWAAGRDPVRHPNDVCLQCHSGDGLAADKVPGELRHPTGPFTPATLNRNTADLPLFDNELHSDPAGQLVCMTCHDVHGDSETDAAMLRARRASGSWAWCGTCHEQSDRLGLTLHAESCMKASATADVGDSNVSYCGPCHAVHARGNMAGTGMWSGPLPDNDASNAVKCLGCHGPGGTARTVHVTVHPVVPMQNLVTPDKPGFLPLADETGQLDITGEMTCRTCHLPHGRPLRPDQISLDSTQTAASQRQGLKWMMRPFVVPNLCSGCHGPDSLRDYLYWHFPQKRRQTQAGDFVVEQPAERSP